MVEEGHNPHETSPFAMLGMIILLLIHLRILKIFRLGREFIFSGIPTVSITALGTQHAIDGGLRKLMSVAMVISVREAVI